VGVSLPVGIWKYSPGKGAHFWNKCLTMGIIAMGWSEVNDLTWYNSLEEISERCEEVGYSWGVGRAGDLQLWEFKNMNINDIVVAYGRGKILGVGLIISPYFYDNSYENRVAEGKYPHRRKVTWVSIPNLDIRKDRVLYGRPPRSYGTLNIQDTIHKITDDYTINFIKNIIVESLFSS